jgi:hypothetical protein
LEEVVGPLQRRRGAWVTASLGLLLREKHPAAGRAGAFGDFLLQSPRQAFFSNVMTALFDLNDGMRAVERLGTDAALCCFNSVFKEFAQ